MVKTHITVIATILVALLAWVESPDYDKSVMHAAIWAAILMANTLPYFSYFAIWGAFVHHALQTILYVRYVYRKCAMDSVCLTSDCKRSIEVLTFSSLLTLLSLSYSLDVVLYGRGHEDNGYIVKETKPGKIDYHALFNKSILAMTVIMKLLFLKWANN
ncbi:hypothetical protein Kpol_1059p4 [Vanderwaltozyma polyspora DSM 70294]|uniref:Uncharacterized protein n=1 Tax=Vanderwaltozyma polyspora (strain ATCC 22028 / DSM 70294 / BCRC 21397 / CBS 2163 / NBRC 10782 / NRRL Y-8283 / UCD 57-17) TaxID=436907 RepID=A7TN08_VANPO|nr:uncharacterized protein Kpol_1059p4 [Vanderwaltozyma polyspora DSM 70294]EDO16314.1 hypothetical protein Kpol_1059p4 [Vanderwaltozyma polyspora DSM 70294]